MSKFGISHTIGISSSCSLSVAAGCDWLTAGGIVGVSFAIAAKNYQLWYFKLNGVESDAQMPRISLRTSWVYVPVFLFLCRNIHPRFRDRYVQYHAISSWLFSRAYVLHLSCIQPMSQQSRIIPASIRIARIPGG